MLTFKLISKTGSVYHYEIYPEGDISKKGTFIFDNEKKEVIKRIDPDSPFMCIAHFVNGVSDENGQLRESGMVAWY